MSFSKEAENRWTTVNENDYLQLQVPPAKGNLILGGIDHNGHLTGTLIDFPEIQIGNLNNFIYVDGVTYTSIQQACDAAFALGGGVVVCPPTYREEISSPVTIGQPGSDVSVILQLSNNVILSVAINDPAADAFTFYNRCGIIGTNAGDGSMIQTLSGARINNLIKNGDTGSLGQPYGILKNLRLVGGHFWSTPTEITTAMVNISAVQDLWEIKDIYCSDFKNCIGFYLTSDATNPSGPIILDNIEIDAAYQDGSRPLVIHQDSGGTAKQLYCIQVLGGFINHAGAGLPNVTIEGDSNAPIDLPGVAFRSTFIENQHANAIGIQASNCQNLMLDGVEFYMRGATDATAISLSNTQCVTIDGVLVNLRAGSGTGILVDQTGSGKSGNISVRNFNFYNLLPAGASNAIVNNITGENILNQTGFVPSYNFSQDSAGQSGSTPSAPVETVSDNVLFSYPFNAALNVDLNSGVSASVTNAALRFFDRANLKWSMNKTAGNSFSIVDEANSHTRLFIDPNASTGGTLFATNGSGAVLVNSLTNDGTGGFEVFSGGASPQEVFGVIGAGTALFQNKLDATLTVNFKSGLTTGQETQLVFYDQTTAEWKVRKTSGNSFSISDLVNGVDRILMPQAAAVAATGVLRMANAEQLAWRDSTNASNLTAGYNSSDQFEISGDTKLDKKIASYNGTVTAGNGIPIIVATYDATNQSANIGSTVLYAVPSTGAGRYRISAYTTVTTADGVSSTLPACTGTWTDLDANVSVTHTVASSSANNTVGTNGGPAYWVGQVKASTNISFATSSYASNTPAAMKYSIHLTLEYLGA